MNALHEHDNIAAIDLYMSIQPKTVFEEIIRELCPALTALEWDQPKESWHPVQLIVAGRRLRLKISEDAMDAAEDPAGIPGLRLQVANAMEEAEAEFVGHVLAPR